MTRSTAAAATNKADTATTSDAAAATTQKKTKTVRVTKPSSTTKATNADTPKPKTSTTTTSTKTSSSKKVTTPSLKTPPAPSPAPSPLQNSKLWSSIFDNPKYHRLFANDHTVLDSIHRKSLLVAKDGPPTNETISTFLRAHLPIGIPHAFLTADTHGQPTVLINPSIPADYFAADPNSKFPPIYVITDDDNSSDMCSISQHRAAVLFETKEYIVPEESRLCNINLPQADFAALKTNGTAPPTNPDPSIAYDDTFSFPRLVYLHPAIASKVIMYLSRHESPSAKHLYDVIIKAATWDDGSVEHLNPHWISTTLRFLWLMIQGKITGIDPSPARPRSNAEVVRMGLVETFFGTQQIQTQGNNSGSTPSTTQPVQHFTISHDPALGTVIQNLADIQIKQVEMQSEALRSKSAISSMIDCKRIPLIRGGLTEPDSSYPLEPTENAKKLFAKKHHLDFYTAINSTLASSALSTASLDIGHAAEVVNFGIIWQFITDPRGFTTFAFNPDPTTEPNNKIKALILKHQKENQQLNDDDVNVMLNKKIFCPSSVTDAQAQNNSFLITNMELFGRAAVTTNLVQFHITQIKNNERLYIIRQRNDPLFLTKVQYRFNLIHQRFLRTITENEDLSNVDLQSFSDDLVAVHNKVLNSEDVCILPDTIAARANPQQTQRGRRRNDNTGDNQDPPSKRAKPDAFTCTPKAQWKIPEARLHEYSSIFTRTRLSRMPKAPHHSTGKLRPFCNKALCRGKCPTGDACPFTHAEPSAHGKETEVDAFYREAYGS